ncbi:CBASS cGAMP synthase [Paracoccus tegillarcae]|uniref:Cyclic GMP-AMP synthase n=1 Tax=Paracoccus tegillarcae TaxID=1529068 RepID=A0A2K9F6V0_9RHOB|nr:nucleotidyltransferase [Paracoccus tegillarcae]AUH34911.1 hypothetical protein CUV01_17370 [Paracoccus tegillarcae]
MGIAANLFHNPDDRENSLAYRIRPSDDQIQQQQERWNDLADVLKEMLRDRVGKPVSSWLQGSYKFGTQIRPARMGEEFDIDLGIYVEWPGAAKDGANGACELKDHVQAILQDYASVDANDATEAAKPKPRCNRIRFGQDFHIDVPSYHLDRQDDARELATEDDKWDNSDPKAVYVWWKRQFDGAQRDRARRLARYLKMWAALTFEHEARPSSILLTVLVARALASAKTDDLSGDDEYLQAVVAEIAERLQASRVVRNPANRAEDLNRLSDVDFDDFRIKLDELLSVAERALAAVDQCDSAEIWSEAFRHFFPYPREDGAKAEVAARHAIAPLRFDPQVSVLATQNKRSWTGHNGIGPIPRNCDIRFAVVNHDELPDGAAISWTVRNEGREAEVANDLGHIGGAGTQHQERSAYRGTHNMDVVVKMNGRVIGRRRVEVQVSGLVFPQRNPARPAWVSLR